jgi:hypothetical protein
MRKMQVESLVQLERMADKLVPPGSNRLPILKSSDARTFGHLCRDVMEIAAHSKAALPYSLSQ